MIRRICLCVAALVALTLVPTGCVIYADDDDDCFEPAIYQLGQRDPATGVCTGGGGGGGCGPRPLSGGGADPATGASAPETGAYADWAACPSGCEGLDERSCLATSSCRATYLECPPNADCSSPWSFQECWGVAPSGPDPRGGACVGLDAYQCSRHDDCVARYRWAQYLSTPALLLQFVECAPETGDQGCYSDQECPAGWDCTSETECLPPPGCDPGEVCPAVCYGRCVPPSNVCELVDCRPGSHCEERCYPCDPATGMECPPRPCEAVCVPDAPPSCAAVTCETGYHCEEKCEPDASGTLTCSVACLPNADPGSCEGAVACDAAPPACPIGTVPGIRNGCWTGYCIPRWACAMMPF